MAHLTASQVAHFEEQGYLVVDDLFDPEQDLDPVIEEYATVLDQTRPRAEGERVRSHPHTTIYRLATD